MAASDRRDLELEKKTKNIDANLAKNIAEKLHPDIQRYLLTFVGGIGTKSFRYSKLPFKDKKSGQTKYPTFYCNLMVLCSYMDRAKLAEMIALNLLWHVKVEDTLTLARKNSKSLAIPVKIQDPYGQWIEATPLQTVYAAGDRNPPNMNPEATPFGLVERLGSCFENPAYAHKQIAEWKKDSQKATEETMAPYIEAIRTTCQEIIESKEITDHVSWQDLLTLPIFLQLAENFRQALAPDPKYVVRSGFLFSMQIFLDLIATFEANVNNENVEDKARLNLGGWWSRKSDALDTIVYPALQARLQRCDLGIFKKGMGNVTRGQAPDRLDFSNGSPVELSGIGTTHVFGFFGDKFTARGWAPYRGAGGRGGFGRAPAGLFRNVLLQAKTASIEFTRAQPSHAPDSQCEIM